MVIGIDIDDTISDTTEVMFNYAQKYVVEELKREPLIENGPKPTHHFIEVIHGLNDEETNDWFKKYYEIMTNTVIPRTSSVEYISRLKEEGNKIVIITARFSIEGFDVEEATINWLKKHNIPFDEIIFNAETKVDAAKSANVDVFIDDSYSNCEQLSENGIKSFLMDSRGNRGLEPEGFERVYSWPHFYYKLKNNGGEF